MNFKISSVQMSKVPEDKFAVHVVPCSKKTKAMSTKKSRKGRRFKLRLLAVWVSPRSSTDALVSFREQTGLNSGALLFARALLFQALNMVEEIYCSTANWNFTRVSRK